MAMVAGGAGPEQSNFVAWTYLDALLQQCPTQRVSEARGKIAFYRVLPTVFRSYRLISSGNLDLT
jgi:hypothetical protein